MSILSSVTNVSLESANDSLKCKKRERGKEGGGLLVANDFQPVSFADSLDGQEHFIGNNASEAQ